jgi:hypothetical protein
MAIGHITTRGKTVQRIQHARYLRIGRLIAQVRVRSRRIDQARAEFREILATAEQLSAPLTRRWSDAGGSSSVTEMSKPLQARIRDGVVAAHEGLASGADRQHRIASWEKRLQLLLAVAERARVRGVDQEVRAQLFFLRLREGVELADWQSQEDETATGIGFKQSDLSEIQKDQCPALSGSVSLMGQDGSGSLACIRREGGVLSEHRGAESMGDEGQKKIREQPGRMTPPKENPIATVVLDLGDIIVSAPLPEATGSVEIQHSAHRGVTVRVNAPRCSPASVSQDVQEAIRAALIGEKVRVVAIDVVGDSEEQRSNT